MNNHIDISPQELAIVQQVLQHALPDDCKVWVFGSRAKHQSTLHSDLDLAIEAKHALDKTTRRKLEEGFDEAHLPYKVDVLDMHTVHANFKELINQKKVLLPFKMNVPRLRFPEFEGEWEKKRLGDIGRIVTGSTPSTSVSEYYGGDKPFVSPTDIQGNRHIQTTKTTLTDLGFSKGREIKKGSILFVCIGSTIGKVAQASEDCVTNQQINAITANYSNDNGFVLSTLERKASKIKLLAGVQAVPQINKTDFSNLRFLFPSLSEQQKIADFLTTVDKRIEQLEEKKRLLTEYKKGLMQQIFAQHIRFTDNHGNPYPDWQEKRLGDVVSLKMTNSLSRSALNYESGQVFNIHYGDIHTKFKSNFHIGKENVPYINEDVDLSKITDDCYCQVGDLIIADASEDYKDIGKAIEIIETDSKQLLAGLHTYLARPKSDNVAVGFLSYLMQARYVRLQMMRFAQGISVLGISKGNVAKINVQMPTIEEQQKIADFLTSIDNKTEQVALQLEQVKTFKKGLLQQMFV